MIKIRLNEILEEQGRTMYWLWKQSGVRYATILNLTRGQAGKLNVDSLDRICEALGCQPGDLIVRETAAKKRKRGR
jgi:putative transcriptional regulator